MQVCVVLGTDIKAFLLVAHSQKKIVILTTKTLANNQKVTVNDEVAYKGLVVGKEYTVTGKLKMLILQKT